MFPLIRPRQQSTSMILTENETQQQCRPRVRGERGAELLELRIRVP